MSKKKSKKAKAGLFNGLGKFANRNRGKLRLAGAGLGAAALFLGQRYRERRQGKDQPTGAAAI